MFVCFSEGINPFLRLVIKARGKRKFNIFIVLGIKPCRILSDGITLNVMFEHVWVLISILQSLIHSADICWAPSRWKAHTKDFRNKEALMVSVAEEPEDWQERLRCKCLRVPAWTSLKYNAVTFAQMIKMVHGLPLCTYRTPDPLSRSPRVDYLLSIHLAAWAFTPQSGSMPCDSIFYSFQ